MLQLTYNIYIHIAKARLSFRAHTDRCDAVNRSIFRIFRSIYMQRNHTQSSNSALFTCWTHIWHTHIYCEGTTQLLRIYRQTRCSKSINFSHFQIDLHALQIHTLQRHDTVFAHTQNDSNVFAHTLQLIYITHTYTAKARLNFCTSTRLHDAVNRSIFCFIRSIYMHCNHIHCKDMTQSLLIHRMTATSLHMRCNSYTSHTHTLRRHDSAFAHIHVCVM